MTERQLIDETRTEFSCFNVVQLATARAAELAEFESSVDRLTVRAASKLQRLPVRLRRRAASHRINRLPRRLHRHQTVDGSTTGTHPPSLGANAKAQLVVRRTKLKSRRYRRRHLRLLALAARLAPIRSSTLSGSEPLAKAAWLPTHLWHAKRFHMVTRWGWRLPEKPNNKVFKACQSAALNGCLVLDMSYLVCLAVEGTVAQLCSLTAHMIRLELYRSGEVETDQSGAPVMASEFYGLFYANLDAGDHARSVHHTRPVLGPVQLLWSPPEWPRPGRRRVYFWFHPAMGSEAYQLLTRYVEQFAPSTPSAVQAMRLTDLTGQLCRLRLLGRQSHRLLGDILSQAAGTEAEGDWSVWTYLQRDIRQASEVPLGTVLSLKQCADFRSNRPSLKIRNRNWITDTEPSPTSASRSCEFDEKRVQLQRVRRDCESKRAPGTWAVMPRDDATTGTEPNSQVASEASEAGLDILLIQNGSTSVRNDYPQSVGWDIVLSRSRFPVDDRTLLRGTLAARDLLIACVYRGAEVGGLRELHRWATIGTRGRGCLYAFPALVWPDTTAGELCDREMGEQRMAQHNRLPPKLRPDYAGLGTRHPFSIPWSELLARYTRVESDKVQPPVSVLRSCVLLEAVKALIQCSYPRQLALDEYTCRDPELGALVMVHIHAFGRGVPEPCAVLYTPRDQADLKDQEYSPGGQSAHADDRSGAVVTQSGDSSTAESERLVLGYVHQGGYDYSTGRGAGLGLISVAALIRAIQRPQLRTLRHGLTRVLMKNPKSTCLRVVQLSVVPWNVP